MRLERAHAAFNFAKAEGAFQSGLDALGDMFEGMTPLEMGVYTVGALVIAVLGGAAVAGGLSVAAAVSATGATFWGAALAVGTGVAVGAATAIAEEALWQTLKHDSITPSDWDDGSITRAAIAGGVRRAGWCARPVRVEGIGHHGGYVRRGRLTVLSASRDDREAR